MTSPCPKTGTCFPKESASRLTRNPEITKDHRRKNQGLLISHQPNHNLALAKFLNCKTTPSNSLTFTEIPCVFSSKICAHNSRGGKVTWKVLPICCNEWQQSYCTVPTLFEGIVLLNNRTSSEGISPAVGKHGNWLLTSTWLRKSCSLLACWNRFPNFVWRASLSCPFNAAFSRHSDKPLLLSTIKNTLRPCRLPCKRPRPRCIWNCEVFD